MQNNNKFRVFSGDTTNILSDNDLDSTVVTQGAVKNTVADSSLYNTLSKATSTVTTALADIIAKKNPSISFGMDTDINTMISATNNTINSVSNDLSSSTPSKYGMNFISKKKLIYHSTITTADGKIVESAITQFTFLEKQINKKFEVVISPLNNPDNSMNYTVIVNTNSSGYGTSYFTYIKPGTSMSNTYMIMYSVNIGLTGTTQSNSTGIAYVGGIQIPISNPATQEPAVYGINKIYEIIE